MKDFSGIEFASEHNGTDVFRLIELAYEQGQKDGHSEQLGTNLAEVGTDLISRAQAIAMCRKPCMRNADCSDFEMEIMMLPSAQPKRGKWRHYEGVLTCSECASEFYDTIMEFCGDDVPHFCPDCGADMRGEKDE